MLTSVVIPCVDRADDTRACLLTLAAQEGAGDVEVVLVDNGSSDAMALAAAARAFPRVELLRLPHNLGFAGGVNRGLAAARGDVLVVLNNDTLAAPHLLQRMHRALQASPRPALVAPVSNFVKGAAQLAVGSRGATAAGRARLEDELTAACGGMLQDVDFLAGLCLMLRRELLAHVHGFDERFGLGNFEDDDLSLRVRLAGGRLVIARDAFLHHHGSRTFQQLGVDYAAQLARNQELMAAKWGHAPAWAAIAAGHRGELQRAGELAGHALTLHPRWPEGQLLLAHAARARGDDAGATAHAHAFLAACPANWSGHALLVCMLIAQGHLAAAAHAAHRALAMCPVDATTAASLLHTLAQGCAARGARCAADEARAAAHELLADAGAQLATI
jgi:GT2 family glycosyltransferase